MEAFGDTRAFPRTPVNIHEVLDRVRKVAETSFARDVTFIENFDPSLPPVSGDRDQLIQVFLNLVRNAADAVPETGRRDHADHRLSPRRARSAPARRASASSLPLEVTVRDNGSGVPADLMPYIFDPFVTTKPRGSGPGPGAGRQDHRRSWRRHRMRFRSAAHDVPRAAAASGRGRTDMPGRIDSGRRRRCAIRTVLNQALGRAGYDVRTTGTAAGLWRWVAAGEGNLVITDVVLPDENGFDLIPRIKRIRPDLPVVVMSAQNTILTAITAAERGAFEYLPKPFDLKELTQRGAARARQPASASATRHGANDAARTACR